MKHNEVPPWLEAAENMRKMIEPLIPMLNAANKLQKTIEPHLPALNAAANLFNEYMFNIEPIQNALNQYSKIFEQIALKIKVPVLTEEHKQKLINEHKKWGHFGWTLIPSAPARFFYKCPDSIQEADKKALLYFREKGFQLLIDDLRSRRIKKSDLEEAIFCFNHSKYKACALILFGIIDSKIIRKHPLSEVKGNRRAVGNEAIRKYKTKIATKTKIDQTFFLLLDFSNVLSCLETMFSSSNCFRIEPIVINRNFICHGMNVRRVKRKDCIKLFLLLRNLMDFIEIV